MAGLILLTIFIIQEIVGSATLSEIDKLRLKVNSTLKRDRFALAEAKNKGLQTFIFLRRNYLRKLAELEAFFKASNLNFNTRIGDRISNSVNSSLTRHIQKLEEHRDRRDRLLELEVAKFIKKSLKKD